MTGGMTDWPEITCQRGHDHHETREFTIVFSGPTAYRDLPSIPRRFSDTFEMEVWDTEKYPVDGGPWCPAHDAVSETLLSLGVWDPAETILMLEAFRYCDTFIDIGAQLGWYSILALRSQMNVVAFEADPIVCDVLERNMARHAEFLGHYSVQAERVGPHSSIPFPETDDRLVVKIDIEGAEADAVKMLEPLMPQIDFMLIEISPCFNDTYPDLVIDLIRRGFNAYLVPQKSIPPARLEILPDDLVDWDIGSNFDDIKKLVASWDQRNLLFVRDGAW